MHTLAEKCLFLNQSTSAPVNKDKFKPYCTCHFISTMIYLYALGTSTPLFQQLTKILIISPHYAK